MVATPIQQNRDLLELDTWRGMAVIFMIVNHAGYALVGGWGEQNVLEQTLVFIGSFAPVLFFFITGVGYGLSHSRRSGSGDNGRRSFDVSTWYKAGVLLLMDVLLRGADLSVGWDFLGFIAISMIVLSVLRMFRSALTVAVLLAFTLVAMRFALGPILERVWPALVQFESVQSVLGLRRVEGVAYWFTPWLVYPLIGFVAGYLFDRYRQSWVEKSRRLELLLSSGGLVLLAVAGMCAVMGMVFFRWGTVSFAYFVLSGAVLALTALLAFWFGGPRATGRMTHSIARGVSQRGVSSLAIVPIHYGLIYYLEQVVPEPMSTWLFLPALVAIIAVSYLLARSINELSRTLVSANPGPLSVFLSLGLVVALVLATNYLPLEGSLKMTYIFSLELVLCLLLPLRVRVNTDTSSHSGSSRNSGTALHSSR